MNFLGVGVGELLLILVIAMLVVGPERMVELSGQMGRLLAKFREQSDSITREFKEAFTLELEEDAADSSEGAASGGEAAPAAVAGAALALPAGDVTASDSEEEAAPEAPAPSPTEVAELEALQLEQRLASDMVDGELEVAVVDMNGGNNGVEAEDESYDDVEAVDLNLAIVVPEDQDVEPTPVNDVLVIPDDDISAELPLEAEE